MYSTYGSSEKSIAGQIISLVSLVVLVEEKHVASDFNKRLILVKNKVNFLVKPKSQTQTQLYNEYLTLSIVKCPLHSLPSRKH